MIFLQQKFHVENLATLNHSQGAPKHQLKRKLSIRRQFSGTTDATFAEAPRLLRRAESKF